ncbi:MAG: hypothetical protein A2X94_16945 [Bdellovibrionales bacterium GWB1_55_8]|nr:MAG: hypothetical protein A2X94_16945 [Bdellovibrionales bacterium GWB1_55_8]
MFQRYSSVILLASLISALAWWSNPATYSNAGFTADPLVNGRSEFKSLSLDRQELIDSLKQLVLAEHRYRAVNGNFTRILAKLDSGVSRDISKRFGFSIDIASPDHVQISGFSEVDGKTTDLASLNEDFELRASFQIPAAVALLVQERGRQQLSSTMESLARQDRRIALSVPGHYLEPEKKILSELIRRMPTQMPPRPGQKIDTTELLIEPIEPTGSIE